MNPKNTALLALVAALFAAFLWFYEIEGEAGRVAAEAESLRLFADIENDASRVAWIEFRSSDGADVRAEQKDGRWELARPLVFPADGIALDAMSSALVQLAGDGAVENAQLPEVYGLGAGARQIAFGSSDGASFALRTGRAAPVGSATYVARGNSPAAEDVHVVPSWRLNAFDKTLEALREARIQPFDRESVEEIVVRWPGGEVKIVREAAATSDGSGGDRWKIVEPLETRADVDRVDSLLTDLMHLRADSFAAPTSAADAGLDPPDFEVELWRSGEDEAPLRIAIGQDREGLRRVAGKAGAAYELASERINDFPRSVLEVRNRTLSRFVNADVTRFEIEFNDAEAAKTSLVRVVRSKEEWTSEPPLREGVAVDIVANLANLIARDIQAEWLGETERAALGLSPPRVTLRVLGGGEPARVLAEVWLGALDLDRGWLAMSPGREEVFLLDSRMAENLPVSRVAFDAIFAEPPAAEAVPAAASSNASD